jgi:hypothetical protein
MIYLALFALLILILGVYAYTRKSPVEKTDVKDDSKPTPPTPVKEPEVKEPEVKDESKPTPPTPVKEPDDNIDKEFNVLTDCVNPTVLDEGECYKNTEGRWKINQIKSFRDIRCKPQRIVDDCPPEKVSKLEYNCSPDEQSFCKNVVGQLKNCKDRRTPITTNEQDLALVRSCGLKGLMSPSEYKQAQDYFTEKGLNLKNLPDVNCADFSQEVFCKNPTTRMENCREIQTSPNTNQQDLEIIRKCGANSNAISDVEYKKAQEYFTTKGMILPNRPSVNCMDNSTQNFCANPREQVEQCKFMRNTTDEEDFKRVQECYASKIRSQLSPEELQKYEAANEYFKTKNMNLILPDVDCMDKTTNNYCKNPVSQMSMCQKINGGIISNDQNLKFIQVCARENKITDEQYKQTQEYLKTQGIDIPNKPDVNCTDLSKDTFCKNPIERIQFCNDLTPTEEELNTYLTSVKNCMLTKKIDQDKYKQSQDFFKQKNLNLSDWTDVNCADETQGYFCKNASSIIENCNGIRETNPEQYAKLIKQCAFNGDITENVYNDAKTFLKTKNIILPVFPNVVCKTMRDDDFCKTPVAYLNNCKDDSTLKQDLETTRICGILGKTSQEEYKKAQDFFGTKRLALIDLPDVDCKNTNEDMFCANPVSHMTYCGPMRNKTRLQDFHAFVECAKNNKISKEQYNKAKEYFAKGEEKYTVPDFPNVVCSDANSFCKDPTEFIQLCQPQKSLPQLLNDVKSCNINGLISVDAYKKAQVYFNSKGLALPNTPEGVDCKNITTDRFCKTPMHHINYCSGTSIKDFTDNINFDRVKKCVLDRNITPLEYEKTKTYFNSRGIALPKIPDVACSDEVNTTKFCEKPTSFIQQCSSIRQENPNKDFDTIINCMKNKQISEVEHNLANEYFKKTINKSLPPFDPDLDCDFIPEEKLCSQPLSYLQRCSGLTSASNIEKTKNVIVNCSKKNLITQKQYDEAKRVLTDLPKYEPFDCPKTSLCLDPATFLKNCKNVSNNTDAEYKQQIINCVKDKKLLDVNYNKAAEYFKNTSSIVLPVYDELIADCNNICDNPIGTLKYCANRKFTLDQEVQQINECLLSGKLFEKQKYDAVKTYLDENKDKLKEISLFDWKYKGCRINCINNDSFCNQLPFCLECNSVSNLNNPQIQKLEPSAAELTRGRTCNINNLVLNLNELNKKYPQWFKETTKSSIASCKWDCENYNNNCIKIPYEDDMCNFTYIPKTQNTPLVWGMKPMPVKKIEFNLNLNLFNVDKIEVYTFDETLKDDKLLVENTDYKIDVVNNKTIIENLSNKNIRRIGIYRNPNKFNNNQIETLRATYFDYNNKNIANYNSLLGNKMIYQVGFPERR